jgi:hypothetical protein
MLTIRANSLSKTCGQKVTLTGTDFTATGLANNDTVTSVTLVCTGTDKKAAVLGSPYAIVPSAAVGTGFSNYLITYVSGHLTVNAAALTITANSMSKTYGTTLAFAGTEFTTTGLVNGDTVVAIFAGSADYIGVSVQMTFTISP